MELEEVARMTCACGHPMLNRRAIRCAQCRHDRFLAYLATRPRRRYDAVKEATRAKRRAAPKARQRATWAAILAAVKARRAA